MVLDSNLEPSKIMTSNGLILAINFIHYILVKQLINHVVIG